MTNTTQLSSTTASVNPATTETSGLSELPTAEHPAEAHSTEEHPSEEIAGLLTSIADGLNHLCTELASLDSAMKNYLNRKAVSKT